MSEAVNGPAVTDADAATAQRIWEALTRVQDPELHADVVNLGLVYGVEVKDGVARVRLTFTSPGCPYGPYLAHLVREAVRGVPGVREESLELVFEPAWSPAMMSEDLRLELGFDV
ncbi:MAG: metal-sulfur cluster assembly factor [Kiritimatiellae bacterium]|nr:metal-sulfur cluster assembly factor [Kiritimatiellia bacterium]